jgi:hypothetical protein
MPVQVHQTILPGPVKFYLKRGFHIKDETDPEFPIMILELVV